MTQPKKPQKEPLQTKDESKILAGLLSNLPTEVDMPVELPSGNMFYKLEDPGSPITMRAMNFQDEKAMMSNKNVNVDILNTILSRCVKNVNVAELLQIDKLYLVMKLREISYGNEYTATISCPSCRKDNSIVFHMNQLNVNHLEDGYENPQPVHLPVLDKMCHVRLPRIKDEQYLSNAETTSSNMWRFVEDIEGHSSKSLIQNVCKQLPLKDAHAILSVLSGGDYGLDTRIRFVCSYCSHNEIMSLPITSDFFSEN